MTLDRTDGLVGAVMALDRLRSAELFTDMVMPPPRDNTALAWSIKLRSSRSRCRSTNKAVLVLSSVAKSINSSTLLKAISRFLKRKRVPKPLRHSLASLLVFRLTSTSAVNKSVKMRLTWSLVELVTSESEANESWVCSAFGVSYLPKQKFIWLEYGCSFAGVLIEQHTD